MKTSTVHFNEINVKYFWKKKYFASHLSLFFFTGRTFESTNIAMQSTKLLYKQYNIRMETNISINTNGPLYIVTWLKCNTQKKTNSTNRYDNLERPVFFLITKCNVFFFQNWNSIFSVSFYVYGYKNDSSVSFSLNIFCCHMIIYNEKKILKECHFKTWNNFLSVSETVCLIKK